MAIVARLQGRAFQAGLKVQIVVQYYDTADPANSNVTAAGVTPSVDPTNVLYARTFNTDPKPTAIADITNDITGDLNRLRAALAGVTSFNQSVPIGTVVT